MSATERTAEEAKAANIAAMGETLGAVYSELWQEVAWIHTRWEHYLELFGTSPSRIELLNQAAPSLFRTVQDTVFEAVLLHLARLTDPSKSVGRPNLSLRKLAELAAGSPVAAQVTELTSNAVSATEFARDWRNRKLAHSDLSLALGEHVFPLAPASRLAVKTALAAIVDVLNAVSHHYADSTSAFDFPSGNDGVSLLYVIRDGLRANEERLARLRSGSYTEDDFKHEPL